jgi:hypothetical protein
MALMMAIERIVEANMKSILDIFLAVIFCIGITGFSQNFYKSRRPKVKKN